jgi:hypothetical protein
MSKRAVQRKQGKTRSDKGRVTDYFFVKRTSLNDMCGSDIDKRNERMLMYVYIYI